MVGKKIRNPRKSGALPTRVGRLAHYIDRPNAGPAAARGEARAARVAGLADYALEAGAPGREKCIYSGARGFQTASRAARKAEMLALAQVSAHSKDPINHYVLSWRAGEQPTPAQVEEAVNLVLDEMGLSDHQALYGLHADTDNVHLHLMVNRVSPRTRKTVEINQGFDLEALHRALARIERAQGWRREANGRYQVRADGALERVGRGRPARSGPRHPSGEKSAGRIAAEDGAPAARAAGSWDALHARLAALGMRYARQGSGAVVWVGETAVKASRAGRDCRLAALERRLGPYRPAPPDRAVAARAPEPDRADAPRWAAYRAARGEYQAGRRAETMARRDALRAAREALAAAHRRERAALAASFPEGGRTGLVARRRVLAARQAGERAALLERQRVERARSRAVWGEGFPSYKAWRARETEPPRRRARLVALIAREPEGASPPRDIRAFVAVVYDRRVDYRRADDPDGPAGFVDRGREIAVYAGHDRDTVRAALQLAAQKWGRFQVEGDAEYRALCARAAAECGLPLGDRALQGGQRGPERGPAGWRPVDSPGP